MAHAEALVRRVDKATGTRCRGVQVGQRGGPDGLTGGLDDLIELDALGLHPGRVDLHLHLSITMAPDGHVGHAGDADQARNDVPAGLHRHLDQRHRLRTQADVHDAAGRRHRLQQRWRARDLRQRMRLGQALLHHLSRLNHVGARREEHLDRRQAGDRLGLDRLQPGHAVEQVGLERHRDQRFDLGSRQSERLGMNLERES